MATKAAVAPEPRQTVAEQYTEFESAFAEAMAPAETTAPAVATTSPEGSDAAEGAEGSEVTAADGAVADAADEAGTAAPAEPLVAPEEEEAPEVKIARLEAENATLKQPKPAEPAPAAEPTATEPQPTQAAPTEPQWYAMSDDEKQILAAHEKNWPDISAAEALRTKQAVYNAVQYMFAKIAENYNPVLKRFDEMSNAISEQLTLGALRSEHEDYDAIYDKVVAWTDTLPAYARHGAKQTMKEGTPEEVAELISAYKKEVGTQSPAATNTVPTVATRTTELSAPAKKAAKALTVVGSKRTSPVQSADVNDFDAAWKESLTG